MNENEKEIFCQLLTFAQENIQRQKANLLFCLNDEVIVKYFNDLNTMVKKAEAVITVSEI